MVLVDPDPAWLNTVESLLRPLEVDVVATITGSQHALDVVEEAEPDLLLVGVSPATIGEVTALVRAAGPHVGCAIIAFGEADPPLVRSILGAGARAYVQASSV